MVYCNKTLMEFLAYVNSKFQNWECRFLCQFCWDANKTLDPIWFIRMTKDVLWDVEQIHQLNCCLYKHCYILTPIQRNKKWWMANLGLEGYFSKTSGENRKDAKDFAKAGSWDWSLFSFWLPRVWPMMEVCDKMCPSYGRECL